MIIKITESDLGLRSKDTDLKRLTSRRQERKFTGETVCSPCKMHFVLAAGGKNTNSWHAS